MVLVYHQVGREIFNLITNDVPIRLINDSNSHCWFTAALVSLINSHRKVNPFPLPPPSEPTYDDGFEVCFTNWCRLQDPYILNSTPIVRMFNNAFVNDPVRKNLFLNRYMSPDDFLNDFGHSMLAQFYTQRAQWTMSRQQCFCTQGFENELQGALSQAV